MLRQKLQLRGKKLIFKSDAFAVEGWRGLPPLELCEQCLPEFGKKRENGKKKGRMEKKGKIVTKKVMNPFL